MKELETTQPVILIGVDPIKVSEINCVKVISRIKELDVFERVFYGDSVKVQLINNELVVYIEKE
jgi:hypothetical protein